MKDLEGIIPLVNIAETICMLIICILGYCKNDIDFMRKSLTKLAYFYLFSELDFTNT